MLRNYLVYLMIVLHSVIGSTGPAPPWFDLALLDDVTTALNAILDNAANDASDANMRRARIDALEAALKRLYSTIDLSEWKSQAQRRLHGVEPNEELFQSILITAMLRGAYGKFGSELETAKRDANGHPMTDARKMVLWGRVDFIATNLDGTVALIVELKCAYSDPSADVGSALDQAKQYAGLIHPSTDAAVFIGLNVAEKPIAGSGQSALNVELRAEYKQGLATQPNPLVCARPTPIPDERIGAATYVVSSLLRGMAENAASVERKIAKQLGRRSHPQRKAAERSACSKTHKANRLRKALREMVASVAIAEWSDGQECGAHGNEELFHALVNVAALRAQHGKFGTEIAFDVVERGRVDVVATSKEPAGPVGALILEMKCS